ncbi:hypothetical protein [Halomontanus rarus]|uniref:hypothetical protein n=1 Tax=Halomontanus rarus TaxID=3034020 RepID=UPI0023E7CB20|nr:hypothetical protein [Halovivax sp. TS33]
MADLRDFGLEPQDPPEGDDRDDGLEPVWSECLECGHTGYEVKIRGGQSVPLCPDCFADCEGLV